MQQAIEDSDIKAIESETGDVLFHLINHCRIYKLDFAEVVENMVERWLIRKALQEKKLHERGYDWGECPPEIGTEIWAEVKQELKESEK